MNPQHQLILLVDEDPAAPPVWSIDERTREIGRRRVAEARALLRRRHEDHEDDTHSTSHAA